MQTTQHQHNQLGLPPQEDWFQLAFSTPGSVETCLSAVHEQLSTRAAFCCLLKKHLSGSTPKSIDTISALGKDITTFSHTLKNRLSDLEPDRPGPWFRSSPHATGGPFCKQLLSEPVFGPWAKSNTTTLPAVLHGYWRSGHHDLGSSKCLWARLFKLNQRWNHIDQMEEPWSELKLSVPKKELPFPLESAGLQLFLQNVARELNLQRDRLEQLFQSLMESSQSYWRQHPSTQQQQSAHRAREEFRKRRQPVSHNSQLDRHLSFMGFAELPSLPALKERYRDLAKRWHPDVTEGREEKFKQLTLSYGFLLKHF